MRIVAANKRKVSATKKRKFGGSRVLDPESLDDLLQESDYVSLHLHLTSETRHIINAQRLAVMERGSFLINVSRGALVDEKALWNTLASGHLGGVGLDVLANEPPGAENPLWHLENVVAMPHIAGRTFGTSKRRAAFAAVNVNRIASGLEPLGLIGTRPDVAVFQELSRKPGIGAASDANQSDDG
jgi:phosphoglycerate dehydrogenase-like enzyme